MVGVAVFREKEAPPPVLVPQPAPEHHSQMQRRERLADAGSGAPAMKGRAEAASAAPPAPQSANDSASETMAARRMAPASPAPRLGTGHGERENAWVGHTRFERRSERPDELIRIRYDSRENLIAMGIIPPDAVPQRPDPFPGNPHPRYVPDPY